MERIVWFVFALLMLGIAHGLSFMQKQKPRVATSHVYDLGFERPSGLTMEEAYKKGFLVTEDEPSAWESEKHITTFANVGNLVWSLGSRMLLGNASELSMTQEDWKGDESLSALFLAVGPLFTCADEATACSSNPKSDYITQLLAKVHKPTILVGAGVGGSVGDSKFACPTTLSDKEVELLSRIQERVNSLGGFVGLRGKCSESLVRRYGFTTGFETMGCPSLFINTKPGLGGKLEKKFHAATEKVIQPESFRVAVAMPASYDDVVVPFLAKILVQFPNSVIVSQGPAYNNFAKACMKMGIETPQRENVMYYDVIEWRKKMAEMDLVVSGRIHGGMISIAAETPTIVIPVDMRVLELTDAMLIPSVLPEDLPQNLHQLVLETSKKFDGQAFDDHRRTIAARYRKLFSDIGLKLNPEYAEL